MNPADIDIKISKKKEKEVLDWLVKQVDTALSDRSALETRWKKWIKQYEEILPEKKNFPWEGCSNISVPQTPIDVETMHEREVNVTLNQRPYITVKSKKKNVDPEMPATIERFLDMVMFHVIDAYEKCSDWLLEKDKMGNGFLKVFWNYDETKVFDFAGRPELVINDDADVSVIDIEDLIFPTNAKDIQKCSALTQRIRLGWSDLKRREAQGMYKDIDKVKSQKVVGAEESKGADLKKTKEELEQLQRTSPDVLDEYEIYETYFEFDVDDDGYGEKMVWTWHRPSLTVLRKIYHPYLHGKRPYINAKHQRRVNRVYAKGICEKDEYLQDGLNTVFNQTIDNATIANIKSFKGRKGSKRDIGKHYPGKTYWLDDPATDLMEFNIGEVHQSSFMIHQLLQAYAERRNKISDYNLGRESNIAKSRATATGTLALLQESGKSFDLVINNDRKAIAELGYQLIELYMQYKPQKVFDIEGKEGEWDQVQLPEVKMGALREEYNFHCAATSLTINKEIEKQGNLVMMQQLGSVFQQMLQLLMLAFSPQVPIPAELKTYILKMVGAFHRMAEDLVRSFEKIDVDAYMPELPQIVQMAYKQAGGMEEMLGMIDELATQGRADAGMAGFGEGAGMGRILGEMQGIASATPSQPAKGSKGG